MVKRIKETLIVKFSLKKPGKQIEPGETPVMRNINEGFDVESAYITAYGEVERDGERIEFQDIRVYLKERIKGFY